MKNINRILVPVHGSSTDDEAIQLACGVARRAKAHIYVIYVIEVNRQLPLDAEIPSEIEKGEQILDHAEQVAEEADYEVETELLSAREVGPAVVDEAVEKNADAIILGVPYKRRLGEFSLGATANFVLRNAPCRVWVCRGDIQKAGS